MRRIAMLLALACILVVAATAQAATHRRHKPLAPLCAPGTSPYKSGSKPYRQTLAADQLAQVYSIGASPAASAGLQNEQRLIYGCVYGQRGARQLGTEPWDNGGKYMNLNVAGDRNVSLAGTVVAFEDYEMNEGLCGFQFHVTVEDLRTGVVLRHEPVGRPAVPESGAECETGIGHTTAIVVKADGAVAWILEPQVWAVEGHLVEAGYQVDAADAAGRRVLAAGLDVDPSSLALGGTTLYWTQRGQPHAATLR
jgi:hypothetical protein